MAWTISQIERTGQLTITVQWTNSAILGAMLKPVEDSLAWPTVTTNRLDWATVLEQSRQDLRLLLTDFGYGPVFMAGLPWFGTLFGRDAILSAMELLEWVPTVAKNTVATLAHWQGKRERPEYEEEPGKILHELRLGEWASRGAVPFGCYYGSADVTPLFLSLYARAWRRTADDVWARAFLPSARSAFNWIDGQQRSDQNDSVYRFAPKGHGGLSVQAWKDSQDSMVYTDGHRAVPPLAVAEVQGYVYDALKEMVWVMNQVGQRKIGVNIGIQADKLQEDFHALFWQSHREYYAMAIDEDGLPLDVVSSNPGHCLWTGIVPERFQDAVVQKLCSSQLFSGWGIRTLGDTEIAYDPYRGHRGPVWPHDTALVVAGMAKAQAWEAAGLVGQGLIDAAFSLRNHRLPESFSGEPRCATSQQPSNYSSACILRGWAAGSPWLVLESIIGLRIDAKAQQIHIHPLPSVLNDVWFRIENLLLEEKCTVSLYVTTQVAIVEGLPHGWTVKGVVNA